MGYLLFALYVIVAAFTFARVEIEIEGPHGWAEKLPTWRISNRWTKLFYGSRPLTGYHLWMQLYVITMAHLSFGMGAWNWSWGRELQVVGFILLFLIVEDFLWFVLNPAYGLRRFRRENIWWHAPTWWWIMPRCYWVSIVMGLGAFMLGRSLDAAANQPWIPQSERNRLARVEAQSRLQSPQAAPASTTAASQSLKSKKSVKGKKASRAALQVHHE